MFVCVNPKRLLPLLKALAPLVGPHFPNPVLETVQFEATEDGRGVLRATNPNLAAWAEVEAPLLEVARPGVVQLPTILAIHALENAGARSAVIEEQASEGLLFCATWKVPTRRVAVRTSGGSVRLLTYDPKDFPTLTREDWTHSVKIQARRFWHLLGRTWTRFENISNLSMTQYVLAGYAFEFREGALRCFAVDANGGRSTPSIEDATGTGLIAPPPTAVPSDEERTLSPIVPSGTLHALAGILDVKRDGDISLGFTAERKFRLFRF